MSDKETCDQSQCSKQCENHSLNTNRISVLESKYKVVEENTTTVSKLSSKVSMLLVFMTLVVFIVSAGALYTYTGVNNFKDVYSDDRIALHKELTITNDKNRKLIIDSINDLDDSIDRKIDVLDNRIDKMTEKVVRMETKIESFNE